MKTIILLLVCLMSLKSKGQGDFKTQYKLIKANITKPFETFRDYDYMSYADYNKQFKGDTFFIDYMLRKYSKNNYITKFISNKYFLKKFTDIYLKQNTARLSLTNNNKIEINIDKECKSIANLGIVEYDSTYKGKITESVYEYRFIKSIDNKPVYGFAFDTSTVTKIKFISVKINGEETLIDRNIYEDLYFPNFCEVDYSIKPVEAFLSPDRKYIYIYLFGGQENHEYLCKIIFDINKKRTVGRMIADDKELGIYQCISKNFIGF